MKTSNNKNIAIAEAFKFLNSSDVDLVSSVDEVTSRDNFHYRKILKNIDGLIQNNNNRLSITRKITSEEELMALKELVAIAYNYSHKNKINHNDVYLSMLSEGSKQELRILNKQEELGFYLVDESILSGLKHMEEIARNLDILNKSLEKEMETYIQKIFDIVKEESIENHPKEIILIVQEMAKQFSSLSELEVIEKSKALVKNITASLGRDEDILYDLKESCKWILDKCTFGHTEYSASQKIENSFKQSIIKLKEMDKVRASLDAFEYNDELANNIKLNEPINPSLNKISSRKVEGMVKDYNGIINNYKNSNKTKDILNGFEDIKTKTFTSKLKENKDRRAGIISSR